MLVPGHWFLCLPLEAWLFTSLKATASKYILFPISFRQAVWIWVSEGIFWWLLHLQVAASMQKENDFIPNYPNLPSKLICMLHNVTLHVWNPLMFHCLYFSSSEAKCCFWMKYNYICLLYMTQRLSLSLRLSSSLSYEWVVIRLVLRYTGLENWYEPLFLGKCFYVFVVCNLGSCGALGVKT